MRRLAALSAVIAVAGCGGRDSALLGTWHVDSSSITSSRLKAGSEANPVWIGAKQQLGQITVTFKSEARGAEAKGLGRQTAGTWRLLGNEIVVTSTAGTWPDLTIDSDRSKIHAVLEKNGDTIRFDLIRG